MNRSRIFPVVVACLLSGACGFHPLYGDAAVGSSLSGTFSTIYVEPVEDNGVSNTGYELRNTLIDLLDSNEAAAYRLKVTLIEATQGVVVLQNASIVRYNDHLTVKFALTDSSTGKVVTQGSETGIAAYNAVASPYATLSAQQDADKRAAKDIAERIRIALGVFFEQQQKLATQ
jgi:LPS-assembly lipoprotein